jgi:hypothetical protein
VISEFSIPTAASYPSGITAGPDGALWFTDASANKIGRITTAGIIMEFPIPTAGSYPFGITTGPDGAIWFTESNQTNGNKIGRITTAGVFTEFAIPTASSNPHRITTGPDGALWFVEYDSNRIAQLPSVHGSHACGGHCLRRLSRRSVQSRIFSISVERHRWQHPIFNFGVSKLADPFIRLGDGDRRNAGDRHLRCDFRDEQSLSRHLLRQDYVH